jgi:F-type H+-transporting ATPase subunit b
MDTLVSVNPGMVLWTWVIFIVLFFLLKKIAWKPLLEAIEKREKTIAESLKKAQESKEEAEALLEKHRKMMEDAQIEAQKIMKEQKQLAEKMRLEMEEDAKKKIDAMFEKARAEIEQEKLSALQELRTEVANLSVQIAEKIIKESLDKTKHEKLIQDYLKSFGQQN